MASVLWRYAHHVLCPAFHDDPARFVGILGRDDQAPRVLERMWQVAMGADAAPDRPPVSYAVDQLTNGTLIRMRFRDVVKTGEPWSMRFVHKPGAYARVLLLEHSEYDSERTGKPSAILCESRKGGTHGNFGITLPPDDEDGFDRAVFQLLAPRPQA